MRISRKQLRLIIENAMEDNLQNLEKSAMPIMDLIVGYYKSSNIRNYEYEIVEKDFDKRSKFLDNESFLSKIEQQLKKTINTVDKRSLFAKLDELFSKFVRDGKIEPRFLFEKKLSEFLRHVLNELVTSGMTREEYLDFISPTHTKRYTTIRGPHYEYDLKPSKANEYQEKLNNLNKSKFPLTLELVESSK